MVRSSSNKTAHSQPERCQKKTVWCMPLYLQTPRTEVVLMRTSLGWLCMQDGRSMLRSYYNKATVAGPARRERHGHQVLLCARGSEHPLVHARAHEWPSSPRRSYVAARVYLLDVDLELRKSGVRASSRRVHLLVENP